MNWNSRLEFLLNFFTGKQEVIYNLFDGIVPQDNLTLISYSILFLIYFAILTFIFTFIFFLLIRYLRYNRRLFQYNKDKDSVLIKCSFPSDEKKTIYAMEVFISSLFDSDNKSVFYKQLLTGLSKNNYSLEIFSDGGNISLYIRTKRSLLKHVQFGLYSNYSNITLTEEKDYALDLKNDEEYKFSPFEYSLNDSTASILTYDKTIEEGKREYENEQIVDPLNFIFEHLSNLEIGEKMGFQFLITGFGDNLNNKKKNGRTFLMKCLINLNVLNHVLNKSKTYAELIKDKKESLKLIFAENQARKQYEEGVKNLEDKEKSEKFLVLIRGFYNAPIKEFDMEKNLNLIRIFRSFKNFSGATLNPSFSANFDYKSQDSSGELVKKIRKDTLRRYKLRSGLFSTYKYKSNLKSIFYFIPRVIKERKLNILTSRELSSIFHFAECNSSSPGFKKFDTKQSLPPSNLPL